MTPEQYRRLIENFNSLHAKQDAIFVMLDAQVDALKFLLEALTPDGCGHENWIEVTTSGSECRTYMCQEPGCTEKKTEPWG